MKLVTISSLNNLSSTHPYLKYESNKNMSSPGAFPQTISDKEASH